MNKKEEFIAFVSHMSRHNDTHIEEMRAWTKDYADVIDDRQKQSLLQALKLLEEGNALLITIIADN